MIRFSCLSRKQSYKTIADVPLQETLVGLIVLLVADIHYFKWHIVEIIKHQPLAANSRVSQSLDMSVRR